MRLPEETIYKRNINSVKELVKVHSKDKHYHNTFLFSRINFLSWVY